MTPPEPPPRNPFSSRFIRPGARAYRIADDDQTAEIATEQLRRLTQRLHGSHRGLIVGPHGTGKSTLIETWSRELGRHYREVVSMLLQRSELPGPHAWLRQRRRNAERVLQLAATAPRGGLVIVDGLEQISALTRWRLFGRLKKRQCDLLGTSHRPLAGMSVLFRTRLSEALIRQLVMDLTADASDDVVATVDRELARRDLVSLSDARQLWFELYDVVAKTSAPAAGFTLTRDDPCPRG